METSTFNQVELRKWGTGYSEVITTYPHPNIRLIWTKDTVGVTSVEAQALHRDQLGSVRAVMMHLRWWPGRPSAPCAGRPRSKNTSAI